MIPDDTIITSDNYVIINGTKYESLDAYYETLDD